MHHLYLSLGSNIGDRQALLHHAISLLRERVGKVERVSSFIETEPWGFVSANKFINVCCLLLTTLTPKQCLKETQAIERMLGRKKKTHDVSYSDRLIDIDLLLYDDLHINEPELVIPHPRMRDREFVMIPLNEIFGHHDI